MTRFYRSDSLDTWLLQPSHSIDHDHRDDTASGYFGVDAHDDGGETGSLSHNIDYDHRDETASGHFGVDAHDDGGKTGFLFGPSDSFNFSRSGPSINSTSAYSASTETGDFLSAVTAISQAYQCNKYLPMRSFDKESWEELERGSMFSISRSVLNFEVRADALNQNNTVVVDCRVVIKRSNRGRTTSSDYRAFNRELRILDHMRGCSNIVTLRGVGWFYNYDWIQPVLQPVLVMEEAHATMQLLTKPEAKLTIQTMMNVFRDVANGLAELHRCGIVHGDMKPANVLLFLAERYDDGVPVQAYTAKISDFNLSLFDTGGHQVHLGGTKYYNAPEHGRALAFSQLKLSDIYSLGMLYAAVASRSEDFGNLDASLMDLDDFTLPHIFATRVIQRADDVVEGSAMEPSLSRLSRALFTSTLRLEPSRRSLEVLLQSFAQYFWASHPPPIKSVC